MGFRLVSFLLFLFSRRASSFPSSFPHPGSAASIVSSWDEGLSAKDLRPLIEKTSPADEDGDLSKFVKSSKNWTGLWKARIEHFEKVSWTGLKVRPYYEIADEAIVSHVFVSLFGLSGWLSASGFMTPSTSVFDPVINLEFNTFFVSSGDNDLPRSEPSPSSLMDKMITKIGQLAFIPSFALFPVDYANLKTGMVAFRFTPFDSLIVAKRLPEGSKPSK